MSDLEVLRNILIEKADRASKETHTREGLDAIIFAAKCVTLSEIVNAITATIKARKEHDKPKTPSGD